MCMIDEAEGWLTLDEHTIKAARKEHHCDECRRTIRVGEPYHVVTGKSEFGLESYKTCPHCEAAGHWLRKACNGYLFTMMLEDLREHYDEHESYRSPVLLALIEGMAAGWHDGADPVPAVDAVRASVPVAA